MKKYRFVLLAFLVITLRCGVFDQDQQDLPYPTIIKPLDASEHAKLASEFNTLTGGQGCSSLNEYGFLESDRVCVYHNTTHVEITEAEDEIVTRVKNALVRLKKFTHVTTPELLVVGDAHGILGCVICDGSDKNAAITRWSVAFDNQTYQGLEVKSTRTEAMLDAEKVFGIEGHWYSEIAVPSHDAVNESDAAKSLVGTELVWHGYGGEPNIYTVTSESFMGTVEKLIIPVKRENTIELRVTWRIGIRFLGDSPSWYIYVDTTTGETVGTEQLFVT